MLPTGIFPVPLINISVVHSGWWEQLALVTSPFQQLCVYLVIAWLLSKTPLFMPLTQVTLSLPHKLVCYLIFPPSASSAPILACASRTPSPIPAPSAPSRRHRRWSGGRLCWWG